MHTTKIFGPPGTGKTTRLLSIMEKELQRVAPDEIAFLTFTRHARREALDRVFTKFGFEEEQLPYFRTLHAIAYRQLATRGFGKGALVVSARDMEPLAERLGLTFAGARAELDDYAFLEPGGDLGDRLVAFDHWRRHKLLTIDQSAYAYKGDDPWNVVERFMRSYATWKTEEHLLDFTDLLTTMYLDPLPVKVVIVDEAQDLSARQWKALHRYAQDAERVYIAGDDDQAIFTWAGADPDALLNERADATEILGQSYRVPRKVQAMAFNIIERVQTRQPKYWEPRDADGSVRYWFDFDSHVDDLPKEGSVRILYRNHFLGADPERALRLAGLAYARNDRPAPGSEYGRAIVMWERLRKGVEIQPAEATAVLNALSTSRRKRGRPQFDGPVNKATLLPYLLQDNLFDKPWYDALDKIADDEAQYLRAVLRHHGPSGLTAEPRIKLSTIHAAKGTEADHVYLIAGASRRTREEADVNPDGERRVLYVGVTRAKRTLTVVGDPHDSFLN